MKPIATASEMGGSRQIRWKYPNQGRVLASAPSDLTGAQDWLSRSSSWPQASALAWNANGYELRAAEAQARA